MSSFDGFARCSYCTVSPDYAAAGRAWRTRRYPRVKRIATLSTPTGKHAIVKGE